MNGKRVLGVDLGDVRTGLAISDVSGFLAGGIGQLTEYSREKLAIHIKEIIDKYDVGLIVMGNPINMNGTVGDRSEKVNAFAEMLRSTTGLEVELFDERCSTMAAHKILNETNTRGKKRKNAIDTLSAQIILQNYLDSHKYY